MEILEDKLKERIKELEQNGIKIQQQINQLQTLFVENSGRIKELKKQLFDSKEETNKEEIDNGKSE
jgi:uncharacterized coiled-coil DUF342 family protein